MSSEILIEALNLAWCAQEDFKGGWSTVAGCFRKVVQKKKNVSMS